MHRPNRTVPLGRRVAIPALLLAIALAGGAHAQQALAPAFTYQGELRQAGAPAQGSFDLRFRLFDAADGGTAIGATIVRSGVTVEDGLFSVALDFGPAQFAGERQWLAVEVRPAGGSTFEPLLPRTEVTAAPYAWSAATALANSVTTTSIVDGTIGGADINASQVQRRVDTACQAFEAVQAINEDGTLVCNEVGTGSVSVVSTGFGLTGGPIITSGTISVANGGIGTIQLQDGGVKGVDVDPAQVQRRVLGTCGPGQYMQTIGPDGEVGCGTDASGPPAWSLSGNTGTNPSTQFIGTIDVQPLVLRAGNAQALRIEPSSILFEGLPITSNTIAGSRSNAATAGVRGATIAGGGVPAGNSDPDASGEQPNRVSDHYTVVGGGFANRAGDDAGSLFSAAFATVAGGAANVAGGEASVVGGGIANAATGTRSVVAGGSENTASGTVSVVAGGTLNNATGPSSGVLSGFNNRASGQNGNIAGGARNIAFGANSAVSGGFQNAATGSGAAVGGGLQNCAGGDDSWAGGRRAKVRAGTSDVLEEGCSGVPTNGTEGDAGTFVWSDTQVGSFTSTGRDQFLVRANGGVGINNAAIPAGIELLLSNRTTPNPNVDIFLRSSANSRGINLAMLPGTGSNPAEFRIAQFDGTSFTDRLFLFANGDFEVTANAFKPGGGSWAMSSDARLKHHIEPLGGALDRLLALHGVTYEYLAPDPAKRPAGTQVGFVAQDVQQVFPDWVSTDHDGYLMVAPRGFEALTVEALRELRGESATIDGGQDLRIATLEASNARLAAENAALRDDGEALRRRIERLEAWIAGGGPESR